MQVTNGLHVFVCHWEWQENAWAQFLCGIQKWLRLDPSYMLSRYYVVTMVVMQTSHCT